MPIVKIKPEKRKAGQIEKYINNPQKTSEDLMYDNLCLAGENAAKQFEKFNEAFQKTKSRKSSSRTYYHLIISFKTGPEGDKMSPKQCEEITQEILSRIPGLSQYPYFGCVHLDTASHLHSHTIINNCNIYGRSFQCSKAFLRQIKQIANAVCREYGLTHSIIDLDQKPAVRLTGEEAQMILKRDKTPWKDTLRYQIEDCLSKAVSTEQFIDTMRQRYQVSVTEGSRGYRYLVPGQQKPCPERRLGERYTKLSIEKTVTQNRERTERRKRRR